MGHPSRNGELLPWRMQHLIRDYITKIYRKPPSTWMEMYLVPAKLRPSPEHYCENPRACVHWKKMVHCQQLSWRWRISLKGSFYAIHPTSARRRSSHCGTFHLPPKGWNVGLIFSGCDLRDKRKDMGKNLSGKAKGKRPNLSGYDCSSSSSSDEEYSVMKLVLVWGHYPKARASRSTQIWQ